MCLELRGVGRWWEMSLGWGQGLDVRGAQRALPSGLGFVLREVGVVTERFKKVVTRWKLSLER